MNIILISILVGITGTGLGGIFTAILGGRTEKMTSVFLSFAGGVMVSIVFIELIPDSIAHSNIITTIIGLTLGACLVLALNYLLDKFTADEHMEAKLHETYSEFFHADEMIANKRMLRSGLIMLFAIALHNFPEGMAIGATGNYDLSLGITLAIIIGLHNIPEGMAISAPLVAGGMSKTKAVVLTMLSGTPIALGTVAGVLVGGVSDAALALSLSFAGGAMLYVVFGEILPQSIVTTKDRIPTIFALVGIVVGLLLTEI
jgi:ZIP family zinc transporter